MRELHDLTVCIPAYNRPDYLRDALTSLCGQGLNREGLVVVVSDDASPTSLEPVVAEYEDRLQIVYCRSQSNIGHIANFARAFELAQSRYVSFLPHDDVLAPGHLARALSILTDYPQTVLLAGEVLHQRYPGAPGASLHGLSFRDDPTAWRLEPCQWKQDEWMASALVGTPFNMVGAIFDAEAFRKCHVWKQFPLWHDRVWCAEMALYGQVLSLPWVCGYYRVTEGQMSQRLWHSNAGEFVKVSEWLLKLCDEKGIALLPFWLDRICTAAPSRRSQYLDMLFSAVPDEVYERIHRECEQRLGSRLRRSGRLSRLRLPISIEKRLGSFLRR